MSADELRPAYRTLNEPSRLFGVSITTMLAAGITAGLGYAWLLISPLPWRANVSMAVIGLGAPLVLLIARENAALSPARLLLAVVRWRARPTRIDPVTPRTRVRNGGVRLDRPPTMAAEPETTSELPWVEANAGEKEAAS